MEPSSPSHSSVNGHTLLSPNHSIAEDPFEYEFGFTQSTLDSALKEKFEVNHSPLIHRFLGITLGIFCWSSTFRSRQEVSLTRTS